MRFLEKIAKKYEIYAMGEFPKKAFDSYLETLLWASTDESTPEGGDPLDANYDVSDISEETKTKIKKDIEKFYQKAESAGVDLTKYDDDSIGHDFFLTRCGHGAGFWDGDYDDNDGKLLTKICHHFGEVNPYVGDDGKIHT